MILQTAPMSDEIYFSTDIETDGPIPGDHSMLSVGCAAYDIDGTALGTFTANLLVLPEATQDPKTMAWWATEPQAWAACRIDPQAPQQVMHALVDWVQSITPPKVKPVFAAWPVGFDFTFVYWYLMRFVGHSPFSHHALDIRSFAMAYLNQSYRDSHKTILAKRLKDRLKLSRKHTHVALDDALEQGDLLVALLAANRERHLAIE